MRDRWWLPGPRRLVTEVVETIDARRSVVLVHPEAIPLEQLELEIEQRVGRRAVPVDLAEISGRGGRLVERLHEHLRLNGRPSDATVDSLVSDPALAGALLWLENGFPADARALSAFVAEFASISSRRPGAPVVGVVASPQRVEPVPVADAGLLVLWWWGRISPLDTRVVVDAAMPADRVLGDLDAVTQVAGFDLDLADQLARGWTGNPVRDLQSLMDGDADTVVAFDTSTAVPVDAPPAELRDHWNAGRVEWWGDHASTHPSHVLAHRPEDLARQVWRGQLMSVLPFVEVRRQGLAAWAADRRGQMRHPGRFEPIEELECGPLDKLFRSEVQLSRSRAHRDLARTLCDARNALAHLQPLEREWLRRHESLLRGVPT